MGLTTVCDDAEVASLLVAHGVHVVLCGAEAAPLAAAVVALRALGALRDVPPAGPPAGRVAALIGDLADPDVEAAARAMAAELFGGEPVIVHTASHARQLVAS